MKHRYSPCYTQHLQILAKLNQLEYLYFILLNESVKAFKKNFEPLKCIIKHTMHREIFCFKQYDFLEVRGCKTCHVTQYIHNNNWCTLYKTVTMTSCDNLS